jgi:hypothetical protein
VNDELQTTCKEEAEFNTLLQLACLEEVSEEATLRPMFECGTPLNTRQEC